MAKHYYTDYAEHMLKSFFRQAPDCGEAEQLAKQAVQTALGAFSEQEQTLARFLYTQRGPMPERILALAAELQTDPQSIWNFNGVLTKAVARERGLI